MDRPVRHFQQELGDLRARLRDMGDLAEQRIRTAIEGLVARDPSRIESVRGGDQPINDLQMEIDDRCFKLLALQQPVAVDLRVIVAAVKMNSDLERVGDLAVNVAEAASRYLLCDPVSKAIDLHKMGHLAQAMLHQALEAFGHEDVALAQGVLEDDDRLDALRDHIFRELLTEMLADPSTVEAALDLLLVSRHLERVGDHATNIAEDVIFMVSARDVRHQATGA